jgi:hypothetical protein
MDQETHCRARVHGLGALVLLLVAGCNETSAPPPVTHPPADTVLALPVAESFEGSLATIEKHWTWDILAVPWVSWTLDSTSAAAGRQSVRIPQRSAYDDGFACSGTPYSRCFASSMFHTW